MAPALLLAALLAAPEVVPSAPSPPPAPARSQVRTVAGRIAEVSLPRGRLTLDAAEGPVTLTLDRNTMVYLETRFGTVRDLSVGLLARAALGPAGEAYWIEIRPKGLVPAGGKEGAAAPAPTPTTSPTPTPTTTQTPPPATTPPPTPTTTEAPTPTTSQPPAPTTTETPTPATTETPTPAPEETAPPGERAR